ncbi:MAG: beta-lactamase family protein [Winogradskyella sp.]|uniref:serine hydrolase domain-containing protein n=1 Tax=Winogradskyella sp. TaxID=1883156 RepID=UPI0025D02B85|nr:serine hydrolase domain-containing protein [Winogradskyella sp.]NRB82604.1 beta-lactamase family protein [Winogradskyella sp.]
MMKLLKLIPIVILMIGCKKSQNDAFRFPNQSEVTLAMNKKMKSSDLPSVVAIASNKFDKELSFCYGKAVWGENLNVTKDHIYQLHSMTKLLTSVAALQLVEKGQIGLDDDLSSLMPEMTDIPILIKGELSKAKKPITLRHLLTHTSGFGYACCTDSELANFDYSKWNYEDAPRRFESGTQFLYGTSLEWVGKLIEKLSQSTLENYFKENITDPLDMNRTFFNVPDSLQNFIVSRGYRGQDGKQKLTEIKERIPKENVTEFSGDDGLWSSPNDYMKLLRCLLNYGTLNDVVLLKKKTVEEMLKNQINNINMDSKGNYFNPAYCCNLENFTTNSTKWGLAWAIDNDGQSYGRKPGTVFWGGMMNTYFYIDYKSEIASCIFTQHIPFNHKETTSIFDEFSRLIYSKNISK